jgi:hypothetical protein
MVELDAADLRGVATDIGKHERAVEDGGHAANATCAGCGGRKL